MKNYQDKIIDDIARTIESISRYHNNNLTTEKINITNVESIHVLKNEIKKRIKQHDLKTEEFFDLTFDGEAFSILWKRKISVFNH